MRRGAVVLLMASLTACTDNPIDPGPEPVVVVGVYALQTIKGNPLPWTLAQGSTSKTEITGGAITLTPNLTFSRVTHRRITDQNGVAESIISQSGAYTRTDSGAVTLAIGGQAVTGQVQGKTFTVSFAGCCEVYRYERP